jgi:nitrate reductase assembly molybdenum cofactor insertion protein NarJ
MISLVYDQRAIPIYFEFLPKLGNSDFSEQSRVLSQVISLFKELKIIVLGDREFYSVSLAALAQGAESTVLPKVEKK